jgi:alkaline phosphatase D
MKSVLPPVLALSRRHLLRGVGGLAVSALAIPLTAPRLAFAQVNFIDFPFQLGIASGDPWPDGFVIWTRLAPRPLEAGYGMSSEVVPVDWEVAEDAKFRKIAAKGTALAYPELAHAVHVEVSGLLPARPYWYRFRCGDHRSMQGRARTAPAVGAPVDKLRFGIAGCQNYDMGLFTAYEYLSREDVDFVYHYGDYIYEGLSKPFFYSRYVDDVVPSPRRADLPDPFSLHEYRLRYAKYKLDTDLQQAHAAAPWITVWDDHEIVDNWASDFDKDQTPVDIFRLRRAGAAQAYYEHMPLRRSSLPMGSQMQLYRKFAFGGLVDMHVLDTRQYRSDQPCKDGFRAACPEVDDPALTVLGEAQEKWLFANLADRGARWNLLAQQVMLMPCDRQPGEENIRNLDSWDPYRVARARLLNHLRDHDITNMVVLTGDEHQNIVGNVILDDKDPDSPVVASEFVVTSISSGGDGGEERPIAQGMLKENPHLKLINDQRGYGICEVTPKRLRMDLRVVDQVSRPGGKLSTRATFMVDPRKPGIQKA